MPREHAISHAASMAEIRTQPAAQPVGALTRLLQVLDLFTLAQPVVCLEQIVDAFKVSQSTAYRYLRELSDAGLIASRGRGRYCVGRRIVELERLLQLSDPLLLAGKTVMDSLERHSGNRAFLLCAPYQDRVLCIYKAGAEDIVIHQQPIRILRDRGTSFPLFKGAGSQVILAHLAAHQIKSLYLAQASAIAAAGLGTAWKDFRKTLSTIRKRGFAETVGSMHPGMYSMAVPILGTNARVAGSILMLGAATADEYQAALARIPALQAAAQAVAASLAQLQPEGE